jgi:endonuclease/exonuclease/phosphatase family metal-dependent hydrolase
MAADFPSKILRQHEPNADTVRVLTYNIFGRQGYWAQRRPVLIEGLQILAADLIAFQETVVVDDFDQVADLLDSGYVIVHSEARAADGTGCSIASRWPITHLRELDLNLTPRTADFPCTTLVAEIDAPEPFGQLLFVNHFPDYQVDHEHERELQTVLTAREIEAIVAQQPTHVVLAGDLDAEPDAASIRFLTRKQSLAGLSVCYRSAWDSAHPDGKEPGETFSSRNALSPADWPFRRIDHLLVRHGAHGGPSLRITACELAFAEPLADIWASDHFGLVADLTMPEPSIEDS